MSVAFEAVDSPKRSTLGGNAESEEREYIVIEAATRDDAYAAVIALAPATVAGETQTLYQQPIELSYKGGGVWVASVTYKVNSGGSGDSNQEPPQPSEWELSFDTSGATAKAHAGYKQKSYQWTNMDPAPDIKKAMGFDGKKINGVDIPIPGLKLALKVTYHPQAVNIETVKAWSRRTGYINSDSFLGFAPGELLNYGAQGVITLGMQRGTVQKPITVTFTLQASENIPQPGFDVGLIRITEKGGWDHIDVVSGPVSDGGTPPVTSEQIRWAYVTKHFQAISFRNLTGIG